MRPVLPIDVADVARALLFAPAQGRQELCQKIFRQAGAAEAHLRYHRRLHPQWGNGSLSAAARGYPLADEPLFDDVEYCRCHVLVLTEIQLQKRRCA